jgi:hypothetical protein
MNKDELLALAERVEALTGPNFAVEQQVHAALGGDTLVVSKPFTASLDAAMSLVPEGCMAAIVRFSNGTGRANLHKGADVGGEGIDARAATPALALTAAALRARAANQEQTK